MKTLPYFLFHILFMHNSMLSHFYQEAHGNYKYKESSLLCYLTGFSHA